MSTILLIIMLATSQVALNSANDHEIGTTAFERLKGPMLGCLIRGMTEEQVDQILSSNEKTLGWYQVHGGRLCGYAVYGRYSLLVLYYLDEEGMLRVGKVEFQNRSVRVL